MWTFEEKDGKSTIVTMQQYFRDGSVPPNYREKSIYCTVSLINVKQRLPEDFERFYVGRTSDPLGLILLDIHQSGEL